ncbi:MAG: hypothetical protein OXI24_02595 [Candidatus Poribacteria bacterium]|nr:hypothetical protein [Candidatus Poribacteria bacterium]
MVSWKIALVVIVIAILAVAIGMWFGYQYVLDQDEPSPEGSRESPETLNFRRYTRFVRVPSSRENTPAAIILFPIAKDCSIPSTFLKKENLKYEIYEICAFTENIVGIKSYM